MATGDAKDIYRRLIKNLPPWFGTSHPNVNAILQSFAGSNPNNITTLFLHYQQTQYVLAQTRIQTAFGNNLDLISLDYLGTSLPRKAGENDATYRQRILAFLLLPRVTRQAMSNAIELLTGYVPIIIEPWDGSQGYYNQPATLAYNTYGAYGSGSYPYQAWIYVYLYNYQGMSNYSGYDLNSFAIAAAVNAGGAGYEIGDTITLEGGTFSSPVVLTVATLSGSGVATVTITSPGIYTQIPSNPIAQNTTSGVGSNATFNLMWQAITPYLAYNQSGYYGGRSLLTISVSESDVLQLIEQVKLQGTQINTFFIYTNEPPNFPY